jgi:polyisoprenoid-binding protein YceI
MVRLTHHAALAAIMLAVGGTLPAAAQAANPDPAAAHAGAYTVEEAHTRVLFSINHMGLTTYYGDLTGVSGTLMLDPRNPAASTVAVSMPVASISTTNKKLDGMLVGPNWFDAAQYPAITFHSTRVAPTGPRSADISGDLTIHGVTKPVVLQAHYNAGGDNVLEGAYEVGFDATTTIKRSDFGVSKYIPLVGDAVTITISAAFEKK